MRDIFCKGLDFANGESVINGATLSSFVSMSPCILRVPNEAAGWWDDLLHCVGSPCDIYVALKRTPGLQT